MENQGWEKLDKTIRALIDLLEDLRSRKYLRMIDTPKKMFAYSFLLGVVRGLGFAIGVSLVFAFLLWALSKLTIVPVVGDWVATLLDYVRQVRVR